MKREKQNGNRQYAELEWMCITLTTKVKVIKNQKKCDQLEFKVSFHALIQNINIPVKIHTYSKINQWQGLNVTQLVSLEKNFLLKRKELRKIVFHRLKKKKEKIAS